MKATPAQLTRLQTCCSQMGRRVAGYANTREARLAWASAVLGREVTSFSTLSLDQARTLIDRAQGEIGHRAPLKPASRRSQARPADPQRAGVDGRRDEQHYARLPEIVSSERLEIIAGYYQRLGWDRARFEAWLASRSSPIRPAKVIRTTAQCNRVGWALKGMLKDAGLWIDFGEAA